MPGRGREPYGMAHQNPSPGSSTSGGGGGMSGACLAFSTDATAVYKPIMPNSPSYHQSAIVPCSAGDGGSHAPPPPPIQSVEAEPPEPARRKRGRPRKYPMNDSMTPPPPPQPQHSMSSSGSGYSGASASGRRGRGRPPGSGRKQQATTASGSSRVGFTPHVITVQAGEDITSRILSFTQNGGRAVCVLSANGAIANVTLRQSATSGGAVTYEGRFDILSLSGTFMVSESAGQQRRTGGLSVSLAGPDGRVLGGCVVGLLTAASPIQVVVGSFVVESETDIPSDTPLFVPPLRGISPVNHPGMAGSSNSNMGTSMQWR